MAVYFIQSGGNGPVKIGKSIDPEARLRSLQTSHATELTLIRVVGGGHAAESWLHKRYDKLRIRGEWFAHDPSMLTISVPVLECRGPKVKQKSSNPVSDFIDALGGTSAVARLCDVGKSAVSNWRAAERIPARFGLFFFRVCEDRDIAFSQDWFEGTGATQSGEAA